MISLFISYLALSGLLSPCPHDSISSPTVSATETMVQENPYPAPEGIEKLMFYIQRDPNANTVCYTLNLDKNGEVNSSEPLKIFWMRYADGGGRKSLNYIQRSFAYGIKVKSRSSTQYELRSVAYDKIPLYLKKDAKGAYAIYTRIANKDCQLERIFVRIDGGSFLSPNVLYVELKGIDVVTGKTIYERITPN